MRDDSGRSGKSGKLGASSPSLGNPSGGTSGGSGMTPTPAGAGVGAGANGSSGGSRLSTSVAGPLAPPGALGLNEILGTGRSPAPDCDHAPAAPTQPASASPSARPITECRCRLIFTGTMVAEFSPLASQRHLTVLERPFAHEPDPGRGAAVDDQFRIIGGAEVPAQQRVFRPDRFQNRGIIHHFRHRRDPHLIMTVIQIAQFHPRLGRNLLRLAIPPQVRHVNHKTIVHPYRRNRPHPRLTVPPDGCQKRKFPSPNHGGRPVHEGRSLIRSIHSTTMAYGGRLVNSL